MANIAGRNTGRGATAAVGTATETGSTRGRSPLDLAVTDLVRANSTDVEVEAFASEADRLDYDDFPKEELSADLGEPDDDEPLVEELDERARTLSVRPDIILWDGPEGIEWEVRPVSETVLADEELARLAVRREMLLERYGAGIASDLLLPGAIPDGYASARLIDIWEAIPTRNPGDPYDGARWNTQAAIVKRWDVGVSTLSRDSTVLVQLPSGRVVPLQFFTWKTDNDVLVAAIGATADLFSMSISAVAESVTPQPRAQRTARDFVPWVRAARRHPDVIRRAHDQFRAVPANFDAIFGWMRDELTAAESERVSRDPRMALGKQDRALPVLQRALVGGM